MAINIWSGSSSYTYLQRTNTAVAIGIGEFILTFKARSSLGASAILKVTDTNSDDINVSTPMTTDFKEYTFSFNSRTAQQLFLQDYPNGTNTIEVKDIVMIEKPIGKATINGIDGFLSGKWINVSTDANVQFISDEEMRVTTQASFKGASLVVDVEPYQVYTLTQERGTSNNHRIKAFETDGLTRGTNLLSSPDGGTFRNTGGKKMWITIENQIATETPIEYVYKKPMLYKGNSIQGLTYSKKTGTRMVQPVVSNSVASVNKSSIKGNSKKNLLKPITGIQYANPFPVIQVIS